MRTMARVLACLWCGYWALFGIGSGLGEGGTNIIFHLVFPTLIFVVLLFVFWRWERVGSIVMILLGLIVAVGYPLTVGRRFPVKTSIFMVLTMALPPLLAGLLAIAARRKSPSPGL